MIPVLLISIALGIAALLEFRVHDERDMCAWINGWNLMNSMMMSTVLRSLVFSFRVNVR
jgi:hypothetical protein